MGEPVPVEQLDMGTETVDATKVVIPTTEHIIGFAIELTRSDRKWSGFKVVTDQRTLDVSPGLIGQGPFDDFCGQVKAMFTTTQGAAVLAKLKLLLKVKPLQVNTVVSEVPPA